MIRYINAVNGKPSTELRVSRSDNFVKFGVLTGTYRPTVETIYLSRDQAKDLAKKLEAFANEGQIGLIIGDQL